MSSELFFDLRGRPPIEQDPQFGSWSQTIPRLWFNEQRRSLRVNDTDVFGLTAYASFFTEAATDTLTVTDTHTVGPFGWVQRASVNVSMTSDAAQTQAAFRVVAGDAVPTTDTGVALLSHSEAIVKPPVAEVP